jgi:hypothetical protein
MSDPAPANNPAAQSGVEAQNQAHQEEGAAGDAHEAAEAADVQIRGGTVTEAEPPPAAKRAINSQGTPTA